MVDSDDSFAEYFILAQVEALTAKESHILDLRYGLANGEPQTLEQVGQSLGISRERVRQILARVFRKIYYKGKRQIAKGQIEESIARLLLYLERTLKPEGAGNIDRILAFAQEELVYLPQITHALPLLTSLLYGPGVQAEEYLSQLIKLYRQGELALSQAIKADTKLKNLLTFVIWPREITKGPQAFDLASKLSRQGDVSADGEGKSGTFFSQKMCRDVHYESFLELQFLLRLEKVKDVVLYQEQPFVIPYELDGIPRTYYPDIFFIIEDGRGIVVEIKPRYQMALYENLAKWSALYKYCVQNGWGLLVTDGTRVFQKFQQHKFPAEFQTALLMALENSRDGTLSWKEYRTIKDQYNITWDDFIAVILQNRLIWRLQPFVLKQRASS